MLKIIGGIKGKTFRPLDKLEVLTDDFGTVVLLDGTGRLYNKASLPGKVVFTVGGSLGRQRCLLKDENGLTKETAEFLVECQTEISGDEFFSNLFHMLHYSMTRGAEYSEVFYKGRVYSFLVRWIRDHTHVLKGMKYFEQDIKSAIELYRDSQRADGMIWDNIYPRDKDLSYHEQVFRKNGFIMPLEDRRYEFRRIPVEADVEYLYVEGIYQTWRATGDDGWMETMLDSAIRALEYCIKSPFRYSGKYGLIKRGFTIDTWDFQSWVDVENTGHIMTIDLDNTRFGIMHGDNTGFCQSCSYLAQMLDHTGHQEEAQRFTRLSKEFMERLNKLSWNGRFFTHHVPEDEKYKRDEQLGALLDEQVSLSNGYAVNRGITHEQVKAILETYLKIKENLPQGAVGEWYSIYPPFDKFNKHHADKWEYVNGGILTIVAGELAKGAFENGYEAYGFDILKRIFDIGKKHDGYLHCTYRGEVLVRPLTNFIPLEISTFANADFYNELDVIEAPELERHYDEISGKPTGNVEFDGVAFKIPNADINDGKGCLALSNTKLNHAQKIVIPVGKKAESIYLIHTMSGKSPCGHLTLEYTDGTVFEKYFYELHEDNSRGKKEVVRWFQPMRGDDYGCDLAPNLKIVWQGKNPVCDRVGIGAFCFNNPHPDKEINQMVFHKMENGSVWYIFGITLSDQEACFKPSDVSGGMPDAWGAAALMYALVEGLAGVKDNSRAFDEVTLEPRWACTEVNELLVHIRYPASNGYVSYQYAHDTDNRLIDLHVTGSGHIVKVRCLLPKESQNVESVCANRFELPFSISRMVESNYLEFSLPSGLLVYDIQINYL